MDILNKHWRLALFLIVAGVFSGTGNTIAQSRAPVSYQSFYEELEPYGRWINNPEFGKVWVPNAERDFQPYGTRGHWVVTEYGNTWDSDYEWGWAPFHYGRWFNDDFYGWTWVPGQEWAPAWVSWRSGNGYYGWAPMAPVFRMRYREPQNLWVFVPQRYICNPVIYQYRVPGREAITIYQHTTVINNYYVSNYRRYASGPRIDEMERVTRSRVRVYDADRFDRTYGYGNSNRNYRQQQENQRPEERYSRDKWPNRTDNSPYNQNSRNNEEEKRARTEHETSINNHNSRPQRESYPSETENRRLEKETNQKQEWTKSGVTNSTETRAQQAESNPYRRPERAMPKEQSDNNRPAEIRDSEQKKTSAEPAKENVQAPQQVRESSRPSRNGQ